MATGQMACHHVAIAMCVIRFYCILMHVSCFFLISLYQVCNLNALRHELSLLIFWIFEHFTSYLYLLMFDHWYSQGYLYIYMYIAWNLRKFWPNPFGRSGHGDRLCSNTERCQEQWQAHRTWPQWYCPSSWGCTWANFFMIIFCEMTSLCFFGTISQTT